jgi:hypothetical protein
LQSFANPAAKEIKSVFCRDMCAAENTFCTANAQKWPQTADILRTDTPEQADLTAQRQWLTGSCRHSFHGCG